MLLLVARYLIDYMCVVISLKGGHLEFPLQDASNTLNIINYPIESPFLQLLNQVTSLSLFTEIVAYSR